MNKNIDSKIAFGVIAILILIVGIYYSQIIKHISRSNLTQKQSLSPTNLPPPTPIVTEYTLFPKPTANPAIASWKTYTSNTVGYTFKAPADWDVIYKEADPKKGYGQSDYNFIFYPKAAGGKQLYPGDDNFAMVRIQFPGAYEFGFEFTHQNSIQTTIEGRPTLISQTTTSPLNPPSGFAGEWCGGCSQKWVYIDSGHPGMPIPILATWNKGVKGFEEVFGQMIATIHFTRPTFIWNATSR